MRALAFACLLLPALAAALPAQADPVIQKPSTLGEPHICPVKQYLTRAMMIGREEGAAAVLYDIGVDGAVHDPFIQISSGNQQIDDAAIRCISTFRYNPATRDSKPIEYDWFAAVKFSLDNHPTPTFAEPKPIGAVICPNHIQTPGASATPGTAVLLFTVAVDGSVQDVTLRRSSGDKAYDDYLAACAAGWKYAPAQVNGKPVAVYDKAHLSW